MTRIYRILQCRCGVLQWDMVWVCSDVVTDIACSRHGKCPCRGFTSPQCGMRMGRCAYTYRAYWQTKWARQSWCIHLLVYMAFSFFSGVQRFGISGSKAFKLKVVLKNSWGVWKSGFRPADRIHQDYRIHQKRRIRQLSALEMMWLCGMIGPIWYCNAGDQLCTSRVPSDTSQACGANLLQILCITLVWALRGPRCLSVGPMSSNVWVTIDAQAMVARDITEPSLHHIKQFGKHRGVYNVCLLTCCLGGKTITSRNNYNNTHARDMFVFLFRSIFKNETSQKHTKATQKTRDNCVCLT